MTTLNLFGPECLSSNDLRPIGVLANGVPDSSAG